MASCDARKAGSDTFSSLPVCCSNELSCPYLYSTRFAIARLAMTEVVLFGQFSVSESRKGRRSLWPDLFASSTPAQSDFMLILSLHPSQNIVFEQSFR